jgi:hypothetical protein
MMMMMFMMRALRAVVHNLRVYIFVTSLEESDVAVGVYDEKEWL